MNVKQLAQAAQEDCAVAAQGLQKVDLTDAEALARTVLALLTLTSGESVNLQDLSEELCDDVRDAVFGSRTRRLAV